MKDEIRMNIMPDIHQILQGLNFLAETVQLIIKWQAQELYFVLYSYMKLKVPIGLIPTFNLHEILINMFS